MNRRISDECLDLICSRAERDEAKNEATTMQMIALDFRDLRAKLAAAEQQIAGAKREGWIEGREHAGAIADQMACTFRAQYDKIGGLRHLTAAEALEGTADVIRAALPPAPSDAAEPGATEVRPKQRRPQPSEMTDDELAAADKEAQRSEKEDEFEGGGSPMESFYERWNDVVDEMKRRGLTVPSDVKENTP